MAQTLTLGEIRKVLNTLLDDPSSEFYDKNDGSSDTSERDRAINNAYAQLYTWAASLNDGMGPEVTEVGLAVTADSNTIALPSDFYRLINIWYKDSEDDSFPWIAILPGQQHEYRRRIPRGSKQLAFYLRGTDLVLVPTPTWSASAGTPPATGSLYMEYVPHPTDMTSDSDTPTGIPPVHRELIAYEAFLRLKEKEGASPGAAAIKVHQQLRQAFDRDMEQRQSHSSRRLNGLSGYNIYNGRL